MPKNINIITITITLDGIDEINTEQMTTKHPIFLFSPALLKNVNKL